MIAYFVGGGYLSVRMCGGKERTLLRFASRKGDEVYIFDELIWHRKAVIFA